MGAVRLEGGVAEAIWTVSRGKCAFAAIAMPLIFGGATAYALAVGVHVDTADPSQRAFQQTLVTIAVVAIVALVALVAGREYALLAVFGGGLSAMPEGLRFQFGRTRMLFRWSTIKSVRVERRRTWKGTSWEVLALRFGGRGFRWPSAFALWSSKPTCLCISTYFLADRAEIVASGIAAARDGFIAAGGRGIDRVAVGGYATELPEAVRRRSRRIRSIFFASCLSFVVVACLYWAGMALLSLDVLGVLTWLGLMLFLGAIVLYHWSDGDSEE